MVINNSTFYYSKFDKHNYIDFDLVQCNEPTTLALGYILSFSLIQRKSPWQLRLFQATHSNENHILDGPMYARWSENTKYCFYRNTQTVITVSKLLISVANWFQPNIERFEMYSANSLHVSDH